MGDFAAKGPGTDIPLPPPYHGIHLGPARDGHEGIEWLRATNRSDRVRVRRHTCECKATIYELCGAGGLSFNRRTTRGAAMEIHETERLVSARIEGLWVRLLSGEVR